MVTAGFFFCIYPAARPFLLFISQYGGQMPGGPMGGPHPGSYPPQYGAYPGSFGAPPAQDPMWGYFTAIAGQVRLNTAYYSELFCVVCTELFL